MEGDVPHHEEEDDRSRRKVGNVVDGLVLELLAEVREESRDLLQFEGRSVLLNLSQQTHTS